MGIFSAVENFVSNDILSPVENFVSNDIVKPTENFVSNDIIAPAKKIVHGGEKVVGSVVGAGVKIVDAAGNIAQGVGKTGKELPYLLPLGLVGIYLLTKR